jgi:DNA-binding transcriptional LysR family regulator
MGCHVRGLPGKIGDDAGFRPVIAAQNAHWDFLAAMALAGLAVVLLPETWARPENC